MVLMLLQLLVTMLKLMKVLVQKVLVPLLEEVGRAVVSLVHAPAAAAKQRGVACLGAPRWRCVCCCTVAGVPARLVNCPTEAMPARTMDHTLADIVYDFVI